MFRYKSNFESFESRFIMSKEESTKRLIKKFNLDKNTQTKAYNHQLVNVNFLATMDQIKMLNYVGIFLKIDIVFQKFAMLKKVQKNIEKL